MKSICSIACASKKQTTPAPAKYLYQSALFQKSVNWMERNHFEQWFILSAKHGLVEPDQILEPYNLTLNTLKSSERRAWSISVIDELITHVPTPASITILAGKKYREFLEPLLSENGYQIAVPMEGLAIGKQLQWLDNN